MALIKGGRAVEDPWLTVDADGDLPPGRPVIVSLGRWQAEREALLARGTPLGVRLKSHETAEQIGGDAPSLALIALEFPTFRDGRAYSTARLLRERYGFRGELRAVGDVLRDQLPFMHRCGFDAFELDSASPEAAWERSMAEITVVYQPAADDRPTAAMLRHPQQRRAAE